jgi:demethylphylloquinol methyltransferase
MPPHSSSSDPDFTPTGTNAANAAPPPEAAEIQALFNRIAPVYDQLNGWLSLGMHWVWKQMAVRWSGAQPGDCCLDLCCGSGDLALLLAQAVGPTGQVTGLDFAAAQLATAQARAQMRAIATPISWQQGDALALPFADHSFDAATMGYGLRNVVDIPQALKELQRVLKPGAKAAILDFNRPEQAAVSQFQRFYLDRIVVPVAQSFGLTQEYAYLAPSIDRFPTAQEQQQMALDAGFARAVHYPIAGGTMGVLVVQTLHNS